LKYCLALAGILFLTSCQSETQKMGQRNGIMIDCSRLMEQHDYYFRLIDFMADWEMNTLILHFSDDHGLSIRLPGYEKLAHPRAFTPEEIRRLVAHGLERGIEIIPELEVFGHTRYITDQKDYEHLYVGQKSGKLVFSAINPLNPETLTLMGSLIQEIAQMFPSPYLHLGCDEVKLTSLCDSLGLDEGTVWTNYVNKLIDVVHGLGKTPMIWDDHLVKNPEIARKLRKDVVLMEWNYEPNYQADKLPDLIDLGYTQIIMAPSLACYRLRVLPTQAALDNTQEMAAAVRAGLSQGLINTIWLPMRYLQNSMWYGIAYSAYLVNHNEAMDLHAFHESFAHKVFGIPLSDELHEYLTRWPSLHLDRSAYIAIAGDKYDLSGFPARIRELERVEALARELVTNPPPAVPLYNTDVLASMLLASRVVQVISQGLLIMNDPTAHAGIRSTWRAELERVIAAVDQEWDQGRYADDPQKYTPKFPNLENAYLLVLLKNLHEASATQGG